MPLLLAVVGISAAHGEEVRQEVSYEQGVPLLISVGEVATIGLSPVEWEGIGRRRLAFQLLAANNSNHPFDADPARIGASAGGARIALVSATELAKETRRRGNWNRFAIALAGGLNAYTAGSQAGRYTEQGNFRGNVVGGGNSAHLQGQYSAEGYDGAAATAASQRQLDQTHDLLARSRQADESRVGELQDQVLLRTTVRPEEYIVRTLVLEPPRQLGTGTDLAVTIDFGGERHVMRFVKQADQWEPVAQSVTRQAASPPVTPASVQPTSALPGAAAAVAPPATAQIELPPPALPVEGIASRVEPSSISSARPIPAESSTPPAVAKTTSTPEQRLAEILIDESMYLSHLSWVGGQIALHLGGSVKAGRRLNRAYAADADLLREGIAAAFAPFITRADMRQAVVIALREHVPPAQINRALTMTAVDRNSWYSHLAFQKEYQAHMLNNLRIPNSFEVLERLAAELDSRFPRLRFAETWEAD